LLRKLWLQFSFKEFLLSKKFPRKFTKNKDARSVSFSPLFIDGKITWLIPFPNLLDFWSECLAICSVSNRITECNRHLMSLSYNLQNPLDQSALSELFLRIVRNNTVINLAFIPTFNLEAQCSVDTSRCEFVVNEEISSAAVLNKTENFSPFFLGGDNRAPNTTLFEVGLTPGMYIFICSN
jgi:hypothetical protein